MATPEQQARIERSEVKVKTIRNGLIVKTLNGWFTFPSWNEASAFIGKHLETLKSEQDK